MRSGRVLGTGLLLFGLLASAAACDSNGAPNHRSKTSAEDGEMLMFCGAGLRQPVEALRKHFERKTGARVRVVYGGSACLLAQLAVTSETVASDLYLPGEEYYLRQAQERGYIETSRNACYLIPVLMVRKGNPRGLHSLGDLTQHGLRVGLGEPRSCAIGKTTVELLERLGLSERVRPNVVLHASTAPELGNAIKLGSIDAAINWDAVAAWYEDEADILPLPPGESVTVACPLGLLKSSRNSTRVRLFFEFATGPEGKAIFRANRYTVDPDEPIFRRAVPAGASPAEGRGAR